MHTIKYIPIGGCRGGLRRLQPLWSENFTKRSFLPILRLQPPFRTEWWTQKSREAAPPPPFQKFLDPPKHPFILRLIIMEHYSYLWSCSATKNTVTYVLNETNTVGVVTSRNKHFWYLPSPPSWTMSSSIDVIAILGQKIGPTRTTYYGGQFKHKFKYLIPSIIFDDVLNN